MIRKVISICLAVLFLMALYLSCGMRSGNTKISDLSGSEDYFEDNTEEAGNNAIFSSQLRLFMEMLEKDVDLYIIEEEENVTDYRPDSVKRIDRDHFLDFENELCNYSYIPIDDHQVFYEAKRQYTIFVQTGKTTMQAIKVDGDFDFLSITNCHEEGRYTTFKIKTDDLSSIQESFESLLDQSTSMNILTAEDVIRSLYNTDTYDLTYLDGNIYAVIISEDDTRRYCLTIDCSSAGGIVGCRPCYGIATTLDTYDKKTGAWIENESQFAGVTYYLMFDGSML